MSIEDEILQRYGLHARPAAPDRVAPIAADQAVQWYAVRTATRREHSAVGSLADRQFVAWAPMMRTWSILHRVGKKAVERPLIPGYVFVLCTEDELSSVTAVDFVHTIVLGTCADGLDRPLAFPLAAITELQVDEARGLYDYTCGQKAKYRPKKGDRIKVVAGPYLKLIGRVLSTPKGDKVNVMLEMFGRERGVSLTKGSVEKAA